MASGKELFEETKLKSPFVQCVVQLNQMFEGQHVNMDENDKYNKIRQILKSYFEEEHLEDVYEGFLRLLIEVASLYDCSQRNIAVLVVELFDQFFTQADPYERDFIYDSMPHDKSVYLSALKIAAEFKAKHLEMVASAFRLATDDSKQKVVIPLIKEMLKDNEVTRAVEWIVFFNVKDLFQSFSNR
uniref:Uncharacterized protein n=1 Tax=Ditylenchus dipsaci TaxID=166011 RepID=A0A915EI88_9BILA